MKLQGPGWEVLGGLLSVQWGCSLELMMGRLRWGTQGRGDWECGSLVLGLGPWLHTVTQQGA